MRRSMCLATLLAVVLCVQAFPDSASKGLVITDYAGSAQDWGPSIQQAIDDLKDSDPHGFPNDAGGTIHFPKGRYPIRTPIIVRCPGVHLVGEGNPRTFACSLEWRGERDEAMFTFVSLKARKLEQPIGFAIEGFRLHGQWQGANGGSAFRFAESNVYTRGFRFCRIGIWNFRVAFELIPSRTAWGGITLLDSDVMYCGQVMGGGGRINQTDFTRCWFEKNGLASQGWPATYAIDLVGSETVSFRKCVLEQQPRVLRVHRSQSIVLDQCRWEGNAGAEDSTDAVCLFSECTGVQVRAPFNRILNFENKETAPPIVRLLKCHDCEIDPTLGGIDGWRAWEPRY